MINDTDLSCLFFFIVFSNRCMFFCKEQSIYRGKWNRTGKFTLPKKNNAKETIPEETYLVLISRQFQFVVVGVCQNMTLHKLAFKPLKFKEIKWLKKYLFTGFSWNRAWQLNEQKSNRFQKMYWIAHYIFEFYVCSNWGIVNCKTQKSSFACLILVFPRNLYSKACKRLIKHIVLYW